MRITFIISIIISFAFIMNSNPPSNKKAFINGKVYTVNEKQPLAEAVLIEGNKIKFVGTTEEVKKLLDASTEVIDLNGKLMLPGFIDDHVHFTSGGFYLQGIDLRPAKSTTEFKEILKKYAEKNKGKWITGGNWDHEAWEVKDLPTKEMIDEFTKNTPVFIDRFDGHMALANSYALKFAKITKDTPSPEGGLIVKDPKTGEPTGILKDNAMGFIYSIIPQSTKEQTYKAAVTALNHVKELGVTSVQDITYSQDLAIYKKLEKEGKLAWFFEPYNQDTTTSGLAMDIVTNGSLREWSIDADRNGLQLCTHAIGDKANNYMLNLYQEIIDKNPKWDRRFRIEHAQHVRFEDIPRFAELGVIASVQPYHAIDDGVWAEKRIGPKRIKYTYPFRTFLDNKVMLCFGTDWTVAPVNPLLGIYAAVTRRTLDDKNPDGWIPEQKITVEEAIRAYTVNNAYAAFEEKYKGSIEAGKLADLVVLNEDILTIDPVKIKDVKVDMTVFDGKVIYKR